MPNAKTYKRTGNADQGAPQAGQDQSGNSESTGSEVANSGLLGSTAQTTGIQSPDKGPDGSQTNTGYKFSVEGHCHTLDGQPLIGTSTVMNVVQKPLHWWALQLGLMPLGWTKLKDANGKFVDKELRLKNAEHGLNAIKALTPADFLKLLDECYYAHEKSKNKSAKEGVDRHALCERYVNRMMSNIKETDIDYSAIQPFIDWAEKHVKEWLWSEMHVFSKKLWTGGISDAGGIDKDGKMFIIDFKSSKEAYISQYGQIGGYDIQIEENGGYTADGVQIFPPGKKADYYVVFPFGAPKPEPKFYHDPAGMREFFESALKIHNKLPKY